MLTCWSQIWTPTFELENCQEDNCFFRRYNQTKVTLESDGFVYFGIQVLVSANIDMELKMFPRDVQVSALLQIFVSFRRA